MNEGQIKTKIFLIRAVDSSFLIAVFSLGVYAVLYSEDGTIMGILALIGLFFVNLFGNISTTKIIDLRDQLKRIEQEKKIAERRKNK
jgi:ABC-type enterochelin transport system permease subunit